MKQDQVIIFDTALRDGEQCLGASMNLRKKLEVNRFSRFRQLSAIGYAASDGTL